MGFAFGIIFGMIMLLAVEFGVVAMYGKIEEDLKSHNVYQCKPAPGTYSYWKRYQKDEEYDDSGNETETETTGDSE
jgi:hypothetical protein